MSRVNERESRVGMLSKNDGVAKKVIVHFDDNPAFLGIISLALGDEYEMIPYLKNQGCVKVLKKYLPDLIILDIEMGESSGIDCCKLIKHEPELSEIPILIYTTHKSEGIHKMAFSNGANLILNKDSGLSALKETINKALFKED